MLQPKEESYVPDEQDIRDLAEFTLQISTIRGRVFLAKDYQKLDALSKYYNQIINEICPDGTIPEKLQALFNAGVTEDDLCIFLDTKIENLRALFNGKQYPYLLMTWNKQFNRPEIEPEIETILPVFYGGTANKNLFKPIVKNPKAKKVETKDSYSYLKRNRPYTPERLNQCARFRATKEKTAEALIKRLVYSDCFNYSDIAVHCGLPRYCGLSTLDKGRNLPPKVIKAINKTFKTNYKYIESEEDRNIKKIVSEIKGKSISLEALNKLVVERNTAWTGFYRLYGVSQYVARNLFPDGTITKRLKHNIESALKVRLTNKIR